MLSNNPEEQKRLIEVTWDVATDSVYKANILITTVDKPGIMVDIMMAISESKVNINKLDCRTDKRKVANINMGLDITNLDQLYVIMSRIKRIKGVYSVEREVTETGHANAGGGKE